MTLSLLYRAAGQSLTGIVANDPEEAVYLVKGPGSPVHPIGVMTGSDERRTTERAILRRAGSGGTHTKELAAMAERDPTTT